jgi:segregation and condensation protein A
MAIDVCTPVFEGPFDLLLHLILREQVDLYEVSLASIVDGYLAHLAGLDRLDLEVTTEFVLIASTLVELKARRLLPGREEIDLDEELALWEERDLLLARLLECKTFKDVAAVLGRLQDVAGQSFPRTAGPDEHLRSLQPDLLAGVTPERLRNAFLRVVTPKPVVRVELFHVSPVRLTVAEVVADLADELPRLGRVTFRRLTQACAERLEIIVHFLAVLELYKQGVIELDQLESFGAIEIVWLGGELVGAGAPAGAVDDYEG